MGFKLVVPQAQGAKIAHVAGSAVIPRDCVIDLALGCWPSALGEATGSITRGDQSAQCPGDLIPLAPNIKYMALRINGNWSSKSLHRGVSEQ